jgi:hypothetical protein
VTSIYELERLLAGIVRLTERLAWGLSAIYADTTASTHGAGTLAAINFRMRTKL